MVLLPRTGFGRFLLFVIVLTTIVYLILNLVSFGGTSWITYVDRPIRFGLWTVCDTSREGLCNQWSDDTFKSNITSTLFPNGKPTFIRSCQALEIISLIFYIFAAVFILLGILNSNGLPFHMMFSVAAGLLFITVIFLSATLGVMSVDGRTNHLFSFHDWAWWNGLVGLIFTIICFVALIGFIADMKMSTTKSQSTSLSRNVQQNVPLPSSGFASNVNPFVNQGYYYPSMDPYAAYYQGYPMTTPSPIISTLAQEYVNRMVDSNNQQYFFQPYQQYF